MAKATRRKKSQVSPLRLESQIKVFTRPNGKIVYLGKLSRGELSDRFVEVTDANGSRIVESDPKRALEYRARLARDRLSSGGYPTDAWQPDHDSKTSFPGNSYELRTWHDQLIATTEPLSEERIEGNYLNCVQRILSRNLSPDLLRDIFEYGEANADRRISGRLNALASKGNRLQTSLAIGPQTRSRISGKSREVISKHTQEYWRSNAVMRRNQLGTAEAIAGDVNEELQSLGLPKLRPKTISVHIAKIISEELPCSG